MPSLFFGKAKPYNKYALLLYQQNLIEQVFPFLHCSIIQNVLICKGCIWPIDCSQEYMVKIEYVAGHEPRTTILYPKIEPSKKIHMYDDHSLCLHYPPDMKWTEKIKICEYTVPWISEWIHYYEIFLLNGGIWEGRESPTHIREEDKNVNIDRN